jgi:hypothetical protein
MYRNVVIPCPKCKLAIEVEFDTDSPYGYETDHIEVCDGPNDAGAVVEALDQEYEDRKISYLESKFGI